MVEKREISTMNELEQADLLHRMENIGFFHTDSFNEGEDDCRLFFGAYGAGPHGKDLFCYFNSLEGIKAFLDKYETTILLAKRLAFYSFKQLHSFDLINPD